MLRAHNQMKAGKKKDVTKKRAQCPRSDLNKRSLPRPKTTTA